MKCICLTANNDKSVFKSRNASKEISQQGIAELQDFIALRPDACQTSKVLAVKLIYQGYLDEEIKQF